MKKLTLAIFMLLSVISCFSQWAAWHTNGFYYFHRFHDIQFLNGDFGIALFENGNGLQLIKTIDKGNTWNDTSSTISGSWLNGSFTFLNSSTGYLEYGNEIDRANITNGSFSKVGDLPVKITSNGPYDYPCKIRMVNGNLGYAIFSGRDINSGVACCGLKITQDGGNSWQTKYYSTPQYNYIRLWDFDYSRIHNNYIIMCGSVYPTDYPEPCWFYSTDYGQNFTLLTETETNVFYYVNFIPGSDNFIMIAQGIVDKGVYSNGSWTKSFIDSVGHPWSGESFPMQGLTFTNSTTGYIASNDQFIYKTGNGGNSWYQEYGINYGNGNVFRMESLGDKVFYGDINALFVKELSMALNTNFDWWPVQGQHIIFNDTTKNTSQNPYYYLGGNTSLALVRGNPGNYTEDYRYITSGNDTTGRFYYWGGDLNQSINPNINYSSFINNKQMNADYVSTLKSTDYLNAISCSNQIKSVRDKNGVTNIIRETEGGGIFFTRTRNNDGHYKAEELVSSIAGGDYASWGCVNPFISEINQLQPPYSTVSPELNLAATYECPSGSNTNIYAAEREKVNDGWEQWIWFPGTGNIITVNNTQNCFPKIWVAENQTNPTWSRYAVLTNLQNVNGKKQIMAHCFTHWGDVADFNITPSIDQELNIDEYTASCSYTYFCHFDLYCFYRAGNSIKFFHKRFNYDGSYWSVIDLNEYKQFSNTDINLGDIDITLRNTDGAGNMQPVIAYKSQKNAFIKTPTNVGLGVILNPVTYYPVYWEERNSSSSWGTSYYKLNTYPQNKCNLEGSNSNNSYFLNYWCGNPDPNQYGFRVNVPLWNGSTGYRSSFINQDKIDAKIVKSTIDNTHDGQYQVLTLNPSGNVYQAAVQQFTVSQIDPNDPNIDEVCAVAYADNIQYCFNLGCIIVNSKQVDFDVAGDTAIDNTPDMNDALSTKPFWLNDGDTLIVGRSAFFLNPNQQGNFSSVIYSTVLVRNATDIPVSTLDVDTIQVKDSADIEALYGYIITGYGSDSFYVQLQVDTLWNIDSSQFAGVSGGFSAITGGGGDSPRRPLKDLVFFKNQIKNPYNAIPTVFNLHQNYPNPFNPSTTIKYDIPKATMVTIKVYDLLGKEVSTLVNEIKQPGYYEAQFNGNNLASGIYFYRIRADKYTSVKKMVLVK